MTAEDQRGATIDPSLALALALHEAGQRERAAQLYRQLLISTPNDTDALHLLGVLLHQAGHGAAALVLITRALALRPNSAPIHHNLSLAARELGFFPAARISLQRAMILRPDYAAPHLEWAMQRDHQGSEARHFHRAIRLAPDLALGYRGLGDLAQRSGELDAALRCYRTALSLRPADEATCSNLGKALGELGMMKESLQHCRRALRLRPDLSDAHNNIAIIQHKTGDADSALLSLRRALALRPNAAESLNDLAALQIDRGEAEDSLRALRRALIIAVFLAKAHFNQGNLLRRRGEIEAAEQAYRRALAISPDHPESHNAMAILEKSRHRCADALRAFHRALVLHPGYHEGWSNLAGLLLEGGDQGAASRLHDRACRIAPGDPLLAMNRAFSRLYSPEVSLAEMAGLAAQWSALQSAPAGFACSKPDPARKPRLGLVSGDFRRHAVGYLAIAAIEQLARQGWQLVCYSNALVSDELTERFRAAALSWRPIYGMPDRTVAKWVIEDGIDILIDLSGFSGGNLLSLFALKPAPLQVSWLGCPTTTGLAAIDYIIADRHQLPAASERFYREKPLILPDSYIALAPPLAEEPVAPRPTDRGIVFGSFNVLKKITPEAIAVWSRILHGSANGRMILKTPAFDWTSARDHCRALFAAQGIPAERLEFIGGSAPEEHRAAMARADIALDSFPYCGGLTTIESLWMGLPVISLPGETFASRHSLSYLSTIGLAELAADNATDYVAIALTLASDRPRLAALQNGLRARMLASPLFETSRFAEQLGRFFEHIWQTHCRGLPTAKVTIEALTRDVAPV